MYTKKKKTQNRMREVLHVKDTVFLIDKRCDVKKRVSFFFFFFLHAEALLALVGLLSTHPISHPFVHSISILTPSAPLPITGLPLCVLLEALASPQT
jgi:hypothetical protein